VWALRGKQKSYKMKSAAASLAALNYKKTIGPCEFLSLITADWSSRKFLVLTILSSRHRISIGYIIIILCQSVGSRSDSAQRRQVLDIFLLF
jgi:hypothetical protein